MPGTQGCKDRSVMSRTCCHRHRPLKPCRQGRTLGVTLVAVRTGLGGADGAVRSVRDRMPSLAKMCPRWDLTILTLM